MESLYWTKTRTLSKHARSLRRCWRFVCDVHRDLTERNPGHRVFQRQRITTTPWITWYLHERDSIESSYRCIEVRIWPSAVLSLQSNLVDVSSTVSMIPMYSLWIIFFYSNRWKFSKEKISIMWVLVGMTRCLHFLSIVVFSSYWISSFLVV